MNRNTIGTAAAVGALLLSGCASNGTAYQPAPSLPGPDGMVDTAYVAQVERTARYQGTRVVWVNKPRRRTEALAVK